MKKRFLSILLALCMVLSLLPVTASAASTLDSGSADGLKWTLNSSYVLTISGKGAMTDTLRSQWSDWRSSVKSVVIQSGVTTIGNSAFSNMSNMTQATIAGSVKTIDGYAFYNCQSLKTVTIPSGVQTIGSGAFENCTALTKVTISNTVTDIKSYAFQGCTSLTTVTIPKSVTTIGNFVFHECSNLTGISVASGNNSYMSKNGVLFNYTGTMLICYPSAKSGSYTVPSTVTTIDGAAFDHSKGLTSVTIPKSVNYIYGYAFRDCRKLTGISVASGNTRYKSVSGALLTKDGTELICCPAGKTGSFEIPSGVVTVDYYAFNGCKITGVKIPGTVVEIGSGAFEESKLTSVTIPKSVTELGSYAFYECSNLKTAVIGAGVKEIKSFTFEYCSNLTKLTIGAGVKKIGGFAFDKCVSLPSVTIGKNVETICNYAFSSNTSLASVTIPKSVKTIEYGAFYNCSRLSDVYYAGTKAEWNKIDLGTSSNEALTGAKFHYSSTGPTSTAPKITTQPKSKSVTGANEATFKVVASGSGLTYQWQYKVPGGSWKNSSATGSKTASVKVKGVSGTTNRNGYQYRCKVTGGGKTVVSNAATLTVFAIKTQPKAVTAAKGTTATFKVVATGNKLTYQWQYKTPNGTWKNSAADGSQTPTLKVKAAASRNGYQYRCVIKNSSGNKLTSSAAKLTVR